MNKIKIIILLLTTVVFTTVVNKIFLFNDSKKSNTINYQDLVEQQFREEALICNIELIPQISYCDIKEVINGSEPIVKYPLLIYRYNESMCKTCIFDDLENIYQEMKDVDQCKILILPSYSNKKNNIITMNNELERFNFKNIPRNQLPTPVFSEDKIERRYFAILDSTKTMKMIFFPHKELNIFTKRYLQNIKKQYLER